MHQQIRKQNKDLDACDTNNSEIMQYALKWTDGEWANALKERDVAGVVVGGGGAIQVKSTYMISEK